MGTSFCFLVAKLLYNSRRSLANAPISNSFIHYSNVLFIFFRRFYINQELFCNFFLRILYIYFYTRTLMICGDRKNLHTHIHNTFSIKYLFNIKYVLFAYNILAVGECVRMTHKNRNDQHSSVM